MTNLPIASSNTQPASSNAVTGAAQKNDASDTQSANPFGAVLARQIQADDAGASGANPQPDASGVNVKLTGDAEAQAGKSVQDTVSAAGMPVDPSSALAAMLQIPQNIKLVLAKDATTTATPRGEANAVAVAGSTVGATLLHKAGTNKAEAAQSLINADATQSKAKFSLPLATAAKAEVVDHSAVADKQVMQSQPVSDFLKSVELPNSLPDAARSAQNIAQTASSMAVSGMLPNILAAEKTAGSMQAISSPLGSSGWTEEFSQKITWMGTQQNQVAELHLNPPNLGPLDVVLKISDNQATALFTSPHSAVRDAVENALPRLREILADNGITLGNATVSDQAPRDRSADGFADKGAGSASPREISGGDGRAVELLSPVAQSVPVRRHNGMVDTFA